MEDDDVGNRFHPTEEQIILYYLEGKMQGNDFSNVIGVIDICKFEPWELPELAAWKSNDPAWYFFSEPDYKYAKSTRFNRRTKAGYWKPTGKVRLIRDKHGRDIGIKKNLVFYRGCSNDAAKTNWAMHEYHSLNAPSYQKPYVLYRLKQKSDDDGSDTCDDGPSHDQMASQNHPAVQGPSYSTGSNNEPNAWGSHNSTSDTTEQEEFVNSLLADQEGAYSFEGTVNTRRHDFNPPTSLRRVYAGDTSYTDAETAYSQLGNVLETPSFISGNAISKEHMRIRRAQAPQLKKPPINCIRLLSDGFPVETRTCKAQRLPKSHNIEMKSAPDKLYLQGKVSNNAESRDEVRGDAKLVTDMARMKNSIVKYVKDHGIARSSTGKTSGKMRYDDGSDSSRKGYIIFLETPPFGHKPNPPSVYIGNILIAVVLFVFIIREMESLH